MCIKRKFDKILYKKKKVEKKKLNYLNKIELLLFKKEAKSSPHSEEKFYFVKLDLLRKQGGLL